MITFLYSLLFSLDAKLDIQCYLICIHTNVTIDLAVNVSGLNSRRVEIITLLPYVTFAICITSSWTHIIFFNE